MEEGKKMEEDIWRRRRRMRWIKRSGIERETKNKKGEKVEEKEKKKGLTQCVQANICDHATCPVESGH